MKVYLQNFKSLNKSFGYDYYEELLSQITAYLNEAAHRNVFRYIGIEFMIVLEGAREGQACDLTAQILERFEHIWTVWELDCVCSAQIGICSCPAYGEDMTSVLKNLDAAVSAAGEYGPNQYAVFDSKLHEQVLRSHRRRPDPDYKEFKHPYHRRGCGNRKSAQYLKRL